MPGIIQRLGHARLFLLAAILWLGLVPSAFALRAPSASAASPSENRVGGSGPFASGRFSIKDFQNPGNAMGLEGCDGETASGRLKWLNPDPLGEEGGLNLHRFVLNNPVNGVDPLGLDYYPVTPLWAGNSEVPYYYGDTLWEDVSVIPYNVGAALVNTVEGIGGFLNYAAEKVLGDRTTAEAAMLYFGVRTPCPAARMPSTVGRIRNVAQQGYNYAIQNPRVQGLNRMQLGKDAEIQATRWLRRWAERNEVLLGPGGLQFQVRGANSVPDVVFAPARQIFDFKLTPSAVRPIQTGNFQTDFPGYNIEYIFGR